jgi:hypothetical protein
MTGKTAWSAGAADGDDASLASNEHSETVNPETDKVSLRGSPSPESDAAANRYRTITTRLDQQPAPTVRRALDKFAYRGQQTNPRFDLWLALVYLHLRELRDTRRHLVWNWTRGDQDGWSPRVAAWASNLDSVGSAGAED